MLSFITFQYYRGQVNYGVRLWLNCNAIKQKSHCYFFSLSYSLLSFFTWLQFTHSLSYIVDVEASRMIQHQLYQNDELGPVAVAQCEHNAYNDSTAE